MRHCYLRPSSGNHNGCRGGVLSKDSMGTDYELEIGNDKRASAEMLSLCVHIDEILEYLKNSTPVGQMIYNSWKAGVEGLEKAVRPEIADNE